MGLVGVGLVWMGYAVFVYGLELVKGKCTPLKRIMWPAGATTGDISVSCPQTSESAAQITNSGGIPAAVAKAKPLNPNTPYTPGMPTYSQPPPNGRNITGPYQSPLPGAGTTGGQGL